jgi:hypothetical protein
MPVSVESPTVVKPRQDYQQRLARWQAIGEHESRRFDLLGNIRLATAIAAAILAWLAFLSQVISGWWLLAPLGVFVALIIAHERVARRNEFAKRAMRFYERGLARLENRWAGTGSDGNAFRDPDHPYADDLDVFGQGSLFELISIARTGAGEGTLARWLKAPAAASEARERQQAIEELRNRVDLREELALLGEDVRAGVHEQALIRWGEAPIAPFPPSGRWLAAAIGSLALVAFVLAMAHQWPWSAFLIIFLAAMILGYAWRNYTARVLGALDTPAQDLRLLSLVLARLERETFQAPRLRELRAMLDEGGVTASAQIKALYRIIELIESARNPAVAMIAPATLWREQLAMAAERWRAAHGRAVGRWIAAVGELEALNSLASYAFEHPAAQFPELLDSAAPLLEAESLSHPLIPEAECVPNDVSLSAERQLLLISGSNMSGKSTLLRAVGLGAVLAWAGAPVRASRMRISRVNVGASLRVVDSLQDHKSRFYAEISRMRQILSMAGAEQPLLFLLDEMLSGTNSHDRRIGAEAVIRTLLERGAIGLVTTHDLALAHIADELGARARNVHFEDQILDGQMRFDYRMREGVVRRSNAIELMRSVGLPV